MIFHQKRTLLTTIKQAIDDIAANPHSIQKNAGMLHYCSAMLSDLIMVEEIPGRLAQVREDGYLHLLETLGGERDTPVPFEQSKIAIEKRLEAMILASRNGDTEAKNLADFYLEADRFARQLHDQKLDFRRDLHARIAMRNENVPKIPSIAEFQAYLNDKFPSLDLKVSRLDEVSGGFSKNILMATIEGLVNHTSEFVIRMDVKAGVSRTLVMNEYRLLESIADREVAIPALIFAEERTSAVGEPFYVMERAKGAPSGDFMMPGDNVTSEHCLSLARNLGRLHSIPIDSVNLPGTATQCASVTDAVTYNVEQFYGYFQQDKFQAEPLVTAGYLWLLDNVPKSDAPPSLLHGDPAFNNLLIDDDSVVAMVDWEYAHVGDPAEDLSYVRTAVESVMSWDDWLKAYYDAGGQHYDPKTGDYYKVWREIRNTTAALAGQRSFIDGTNTHCKMPFATSLLPQIYLEALATMRDSYA